MTAALRIFWVDDFDSWLSLPGGHWQSDAGEPATDVLDDPYEVQVAVARRPLTGDCRLQCCFLLLPLGSDALSYCGECVSSVTVAPHRHLPVVSGDQLPTGWGTVSALHPEARCDGSPQ